jgi:hypothetical protein
MYTGQSLCSIRRHSCPVRADGLLRVPYIDTERAHHFATRTRVRLFSALSLPLGSALFDPGSRSGVWGVAPSDRVAISRPHSPFRFHSESQSQHRPLSVCLSVRLPVCVRACLFDYPYVGHLVSLLVFASFCFTLSLYTSVSACVCSMCSEHFLPLLP